MKGIIHSYNDNTRSGIIEGTNGDLYTFLSIECHVPSDKRIEGYPVTFRTEGDGLAHDIFTQKNMNTPQYSGLLSKIKQLLS